MVTFSCFFRYLNDKDYFGGFEQEDLNQLFEAMQSNFKAWVSGFAPLAVGADIDSMAVQEFGRTLFNIRPDIAFSVARTIFQSDLRNMLPKVCMHAPNFSFSRKNLLSGFANLAIRLISEEITGGDVCNVIEMLDIAGDCALPYLAK